MRSSRGRRQEDRLGCPRRPPIARPPCPSTHAFALALLATACQPDPEATRRPAPSATTPQGTEVPPGFPEVVVTGSWRHPLWLSLFQAEGASFAAILDEGARVVWARAPVEPEGRILRMRAVEGGVAWAEGHRHREVEFGTLGRLTWGDATPEWTRAPYVHHDFVERDGGYLYLAHTFRDAPTGDGTLAADDVVAWVPRGATATEVADVRFRVADHLAWSLPCGHAAHDTWVPDAWDWTHANSLVEDGDDLWVMVRYHDTAWRLDSTFALVERVGGIDGDPLVDGALPLAHSHISRFHDGRMLVLDNRNHDGPARALWLARGPDGWRIERSIDGERALVALGDVQALDDGSVVIAWGTEGRIDAYDADGAWEGRLEVPGYAFGRIDVRAVPDSAR